MPDAFVLAGTSHSVRTLLRAIDVLAPLDAHMILYGEAGTGRRTCATLLHQGGPRSGQPLRAISLRGLTDAQMADRLFGGRGLAGLAAQARNATLYVDAIDRLPHELQARLLAAIGDDGPGIRLVAASSVALAEHARNGCFSRALFARLGAVQLSIPPLRERLEDIPAIADQVLQQWSERHGKQRRRLAAAALHALERHPWLGNVDELVRVLETGCAQTRSLRITADRVQAVLGRRTQRDATADILPLAEIELFHIRNAIARCGGNQSIAAKRLGIGRNTLARRLRQRERPRPRGIRASTRRDATHSNAHSTAPPEELGLTF